MLSWPDDDWTDLVAALGATEDPQRRHLSLSGATELVCTGVRTSRNPLDGSTRLYATTTTGGERLLGDTERPAAAWNRIVLHDDLLPNDDDTEEIE